MEITVDKIAATMMDAWEQAEHEPVNASYVATFADMARAVKALLDSHDVVVVE